MLSLQSAPYQDYLTIFTMSTTEHQE